MRWIWVVWLSASACSLYFKSDPPPPNAVDPDSGVAPGPDEVSLPCIRTVLGGRFNAGPPELLVTHACGGDGSVVEHRGAHLAQLDAHGDWSYQFARTIPANLHDMAGTDVLAQPDTPGAPAFWELSDTSGYSIGFERPVLDASAADLDGDGAVDLVVAGDRALRVALKFPTNNAVSITNSDEVVLADGSAMTFGDFDYVAVGDFAGSTANDVLFVAGASAGDVPPGSQSEIELATQTGPLAFDIQVLSHTLDFPTGPMVSGDIDGDGKLDVAIPFANGISIWSSRAGQLVGIAEGTSALAIGDIDGDGHDELVYVTADGSATRRTRLEAGTTTEAVLDDGGGAIALADLDGDGRDDIVLVHDLGLATSTLVLHASMP